MNKKSGKAQRLRVRKTDREKGKEWTCTKTNMEQNERTNEKQRSRQREK